MSLRMSYIDLIKQFWIVASGNNISTTQLALYFALLHECNNRMWPSSFQCSNQRICAAIGIREKTLIESRFRLKEIGLIEFEPGITKKRNPTYYILEYLHKVSNEVGITGTIPVSISETLREVKSGTSIKTRQDKIKNKIGSALNTPFFKKNEKEKYILGLKEFTAHNCPDFIEMRKSITDEQWEELIELYPGESGYKALKAVLFKMHAEGLTPNNSVAGKLRVWIRNEKNKSLTEQIEESESLRGLICRYRTESEFRKEMDDHLLEQNADTLIIKKIGGKYKIGAEKISDRLVIKKFNNHESSNGNNS
jgi:hypothetical protein